MRRVLILAAGLGLLGTAVGCGIHGVCDCDVAPPGPADHPAAVHYAPPAAGAVVVQPPVMQAEPLSVMPKAGH